MSTRPSTYYLDLLEGDNPRLLVDHYGEPTAGQKERYLNNPTRCPHCNDGNIEGGFVEIDAGGASQVVTCLACGKRWIDLYTLTDIQLIEG